MLLTVKDYDETYVPITNVVSIKTLLLVANHFGYQITHNDIETMFLNSDLKEEIYLKPPDRIDIEGNVYWNYVKHHTD